MITEKKYLNVTEAANYLGMTVEEFRSILERGELTESKAPGGRMILVRLDDVKVYAQREKPKAKPGRRPSAGDVERATVNDTVQTVFVKDSRSMTDLDSDSVHLMITSPPYFNAKVYSSEPIEGDLGAMQQVDAWFAEMRKVWKEVHRVLQPGRRAFINIMNLPVREEDGGFKSLNLAGRTIDVCSEVGFVFKRDIIWQKTNAVRAPFGTYPYPGGILLNNMHEFILEFEKPAKRGAQKYKHVTESQREQSKLDKDFWLSIKKSDVWVMAPEASGDRRAHITPFPYELPCRLIRAFSYVGETILDPFVGSGTTLVAAADLKRNGIGYEINPGIASVALHALSRYQTRLF